VGSDEVAQSMVSMKDLRGADVHGGAQQLISVDDAASFMLSVVQNARAAT
jgi:hypothetical protein